MIEQMEVGTGIEGCASHAPTIKNNPIKIIHKWFQENKREFPWRENRTPYRVWISEVMLQQTRAIVVIPYFLRWMELFPDVKALYKAPIEQVIKAWEGLGYYSRARNLHLAAKQIVEQFDGEIPDQREDLRSIRGFGPYTVGALLSFAFHKRAVAIDGNVQRVISRYFLVEENIGRSSTRKKIEIHAESLLDLQKPWVSAEALIELGATICTPKPRCEICPLNSGCQAFFQEKAESLPVKNVDKGIESLFRIVFVLEYNGFVLVGKGDVGKVMAGLYEFPYVNSQMQGERQILQEAKKFIDGDVVMIHKLTEQVHSFTRYRAYLSPYWIRVRKNTLLQGFEWVPFSSLSKLPFSSGHRKIATEIEKIRMDAIKVEPVYTSDL